MKILFYSNVEEIHACVENNAKWALGIFLLLLYTRCYPLLENWVIGDWKDGLVIENLSGWVLGSLSVLLVNIILVPRGAQGWTSVFYEGSAHFIFRLYGMVCVVSMELFCYSSMHRSAHSFLDSVAWYVLSVWSFSAVAPMHKQKNVTCSNNSLLVNVEIWILCSFHILLNNISLIFFL